MSIIKKILPGGLYKFLVNNYESYINKFIIESYSQEGEDLILKRIFNGKKNGFYVDVGAHHPKRFSNTFLFYKMGWRGINIEPRPGSKKLFDKYRKRDINIEAAISNSNENLTYYIFDEPALNSFDKELSLTRVENTKYKLLEEISIETKTLSEILYEYLPDNQQIDFLTIDTEGFDLMVLKSNNWDKYRPEVILCEDGEFNFQSPSNSEIYNFLIEKNYFLIAKTLNTLLFKLKYN
jgi:FkbM family methyltransferase